MNWLEVFLESLAPSGRQSPTPFEEDERRWFQAGVEHNEFRFDECIASCPRLRRWSRTVRDEFITPHGKTRHLFNLVRDDPNSCFLAREYIPHIAAVSRLLIQKKFDRRRYSFSLYRSFTRDLILKRCGEGYETDAEFYDSHGAVHLLVEAKKSRHETEAIATQIDALAEWGPVPARHRKELEYVLDLQPKYLWLVGPGLIDPEQFVYEVQVEDMKACFRRIDALPNAPK